VKAAIQERALALGFDACRFTTAQPPESAAHFQRWLEAGCHGQMAYLERNAHKRVAPSQVLAEAKSLVVLAVSYAGDWGEGEGLRLRARLGLRAGEGAEKAPGLLDPNLNLNPDLNPAPALHPTPAAPASASNDRFPGEIARYARYADYHEVLARRLRALAEYVNGIGGVGTRSLWYVDTGPLLERDLAQRAGLGFVGKHTNLITRRLGNWFFLAEIITTLELPPDAPEKNRCGSCRSCLDACPTGAITAPFQLDARRCISYLTIELKGAIPVELRPALGNRIYGCDDCLAACPWNRFARAGAMMAEHRRMGLEAPELAELLSLDERGFQERFAGTPILRAKRRGFLRNVCVALGNVGNEGALPALQRLAGSSEPLVAEHALWAIGRIQERREGG
jgi:epoxyqueuosine reductase